MNVSQQVAISCVIGKSAKNNQFSYEPRLCSNLVDRANVEKHLEETLLNNGYPRRLIHQIFFQTRSIPQTEKEPLETTVVIPYTHRVSEPIRRILAPLNIRTCFCPHRSLRNILTHVKDPVALEHRTGVVYSIISHDCPVTYVGQTMLYHVPFSVRGSNALFLAMDALFCFCLSKASNSDSKLLCLALDSLSHSLLILIVPSGSNCLLRFIAIFLFLAPIDLRLQIVWPQTHLAFLTFTDAEHCGHSLVKGIVHKIC